jgi:2'-5' RNA ligase
LIRAFIAIELDDTTLAVAKDAQRALGDLAARKLAPETLHLTLKFLGDVPEETARAELDAMTIAKAPPLGTGTLDAFPSASRGKIIIIACSDPSGGIAALGKGDPKFHPHVTIARAKKPVDRRRRSPMAIDVRKIAAKFGTRECGTPKRVVLFRSELSRTGAKHFEIASKAFL